MDALTENVSRRDNEIEIEGGGEIERKRKRKRKEKRAREEEGKERKEGQGAIACLGKHHQHGECRKVMDYIGRAGERGRGIITEAFGKILSGAILSAFDFQPVFQPLFQRVEMAQWLSK